MEEPSRIEKMVGELLGLRMLVTQLLKAEAARSGGPDAMAGIRAATLAAIADWPIGSDTAEGAERIRRCAQGMLSEFPAPARVA
jgi:hypothetical protein